MNTSTVVNDHFIYDSKDDLSKLVGLIFDSRDSRPHSKVIVFGLKMYQARDVSKKVMTPTYGMDVVWCRGF